MPKGPSHFSGIAWVNPLNPSLGYDFRQDWNRTQDYHVRNGNAYVMWTSAPWSVDALKGNDPQRYAALNRPFNESPDGEVPYEVPGASHDDQQSNTDPAYMALHGVVTPPSAIEV